MLFELNQVYRKDIDDKPPFLFMELPVFKDLNFKYKYSRTHQGLISVTSKKTIAFISLQEKRKKFEVDTGINAWIIDYSIFGEAENRVVSLTDQGHVVFQIFHFSRRKLLSSFCLKLELIDDLEEGNSLVLNDENDLVFLELDHNAFFSSRIMILKIEGSILVKKAFIERTYSDRIHKIYSPRFVSSFGGNCLWIGLESEFHGSVMVFEYNRESETLRELEELRELHQEASVFDLIHMGDKFYYTGNGGKLMRLTVKS